jgi:rhodanese-related sulfurtransferase
MVKEIESERLKSRLGDSEPPLLVDIRTPAEVAGGAIPGAAHIPMQLLPVRLDELPRGRDVVLYCRSGARSYHACQYLAQQGFENTINLRGGIIAWARHGFPIVPPPPD